MQKYYGRVTDTNGNPVASARLTVYQANVISPLPVIFQENADKTLGSLSNPLLTNSAGEYSFIVAPGQYQIRATGSSAVLNISKTVTQYVQQDAEEVAPVKYNREVFYANATWTAPLGVTQATVTNLGGGAGGARADLPGAGAVGGVGGGAGATVVRTLEITPLAAYSIVIGAGGIGGTTGAGTDGGDTSLLVHSEPERPAVESRRSRPAPASLAAAGSSAGDWK